MIKAILQNIVLQILRLTKILAKCILALWRVLLAIIYFILCWVFVVIIAIIEILAGHFNLEITKSWVCEMQTLDDLSKDLKWYLKDLYEHIKL